MLTDYSIKKLLAYCALLFIPNITFSQIHVGLSGAYSNIDFKQGYGNNAFSKYATGIDVFADYMVNNCLGAEIGYEYISKKNKTVTAYTNEMFVGSTVNPPTLFESYHTSIKYNNHYFGIKGKINTMNDSNFLSVVLGIAEFYIKSKYNLFADNAGPEDITRSFIKNKPVLLIKMSAGIEIAKNCSLVTTISFKNTNNIKIASEERGTSGPSEVKLKNTTTVNIGIMYSII